MPGTVDVVSLGSQIRHYREGLGLTLEALSERSDVEVGTINALENRGSNRSQFASQLANALGLSLEELLDESVDYLDRLRKRPMRLLQAAEPTPVWRDSSWPFTSFSRGDLATLSAEEHASIEGFVQGLLAARKRQAGGGM